MRARTAAVPTGGTAPGRRALPLDRLDPGERDGVDGLDVGRAAAPATIGTRTPSCAASEWSTAAVSPK